MRTVANTAAVQALEAQGRRADWDRLAAVAFEALRLKQTEGSAACTVYLADQLTMDELYILLEWQAIGRGGVPWKSAPH